MSSTQQATLQLLNTLLLQVVAVVGLVQAQAVLVVAVLGAIAHLLLVKVLVVAHQQKAGSYLHLAIPPL